MWMLLLLACQAIEGAQFMQRTEAHRLALTLRAGDCWGLEVLDTPERLPSCVPGQSQPHAVADALAERLSRMGEGASPSEKLWLALNAQRAGSMRSWQASERLLSEALDAGLSGAELRAVSAWLMPPSALVHILQWEQAQIVLEQKDPALADAWTARELALSTARPWTPERLAAIPEVPPEWVSQFEAAIALQSRLERVAAGS